VDAERILAEGRAVERVAPHRQRPVEAVVAVLVAQVAGREELADVRGVVEARIVLDDADVVVDVPVRQRSGEGQSDEEDHQREADEVQAPRADAVRGGRIGNAGNTARGGRCVHAPAEPTRGDAVVWRAGEGFQREPRGCLKCKLVAPGLDPCAPARELGGGDC
jgi:hypothetical protein